MQALSQLSYSPKLVAAPDCTDGRGHDSRPGRCRGRSARRTLSSTHPDGRAPLRPARRSSPSGRRSGSASAPGRSPTTGERCAAPRPEVLRARDAAVPVSGEPHIGHLKNYSVGDAVAHFHRRTGVRVLHPMGYDAFGLPAENHAIKTGEHPRESTEAVDRAVPAAVPRVGHLDRLVARVRHARAALLPLDAVDLPAALRARAGLPQGGRGQLVPEGRRPCWPTSRSSTGAASAAARRSRLRQLEQWFFRITDYADRLLDDLDTIEWPQHVKTMQRNWIGRSEGAEVTFRCARARRRLPGLHHAPGHAVRRDVLRHGARAPRRAAAGRGHRARGRRSATTSTTR